MLDGCMQLIFATNGTKVKIGATYGTERRPSRNGFIQMKATFPFITSDLEESINFSNIDLMQRPEPTSAPSVAKNDTESDLPWEK
jgi:hypothetical protein